METEDEQTRKPRKAPLFFEKRSDKFKRRLINSYITKDWEKFKTNYKYFFDCVIELARSQGILDVRIEGKHGEEYLKFDDADNLRNSWKPQRENKQFCSVDNVANTSRPNTVEVHKTKNRLFPRPGVVSSSSSNYPQENKTNNTNNTQMYQKDEELYKMQMEEIMKTKKDTRKMLKDDSFIKNHELNRKESEKSRTSSDFHFRRDAMDASFQRKLSAQNEQFAEEMRKMKEKRERLNREADEEMKKFRRESALRIQMLLNCIHLKIRWEEQEQEWSDWLKCARDPVIKVKTQFMDFDRIRTYDDEGEIRSEVIYFHKFVQIAYDKLVYEFGNIGILADKYENKLFLKVIQQSVSDMATKLCNLMDGLDQFKNNKQFFTKINDLESAIDSMEIPTTSKIRQICSSASNEEYQTVNPPKKPKTYCVITEEFS